MLNAHVVKVRRQFTVDATMQLATGEVRAVIGASGAGKSTLLACIGGAEVPDGGHVELDGIRLFPPEVSLHRRGIGYLTQETSLFPHLHVDENVRFGLRNGAAEDWIAELRDRLDLAPIWSHPAIAVSGGQARRVAFARMLARKPRLVLLDEPFSGLDRPVIRDLTDAIGGWQRQLGFAMLAVDHNVEALQRLAPRVSVIDRGRILQEGTWAAVRAQPVTESLAGLLAPL